MTTAIRKLFVMLLIGVVFLMANIWCVAHWLDRRGKPVHWGAPSLRSRSGEKWS